MSCFHLHTLLIQESRDSYSESLSDVYLTIFPIKCHDLQLALDVHYETSAILTGRSGRRH